MNWLNRIFLALFVDLKDRVLLGKLNIYDKDLARRLRDEGYKEDWIRAIENGNPELMEDVQDVARKDMLYEESKKRKN